MIRSVTPDDAAEIAGIYNYYIENTTITFEESPVDEAEMRRRIKTVTAGYPWLVSVEGGHVTGYCYASQFAERSAYRYTADISIYVDKDCQSRGTGTALFTHIIEACRTLGMHALISIITTPNEKSRAIHQKMGFKKTAEFTEVGRKFDKWIGVTYWEYLYEKR